VSELLAAALEVRNGQPITVDGPYFKIKVAPASKAAGPMLAATTIAYSMTRRGTFAILSPAKPARSAYVRSIIETLKVKQFGKANLGPFPNLRWESGGDDGGDGLRAQLLATDPHQYDDIASLLTASTVPAAGQMAAALRRLRDARGQREFSAAEVVALFDRCRTLANQFGRRKMGSRRLLTIHQAKNREFDHVVIIWPYEIASDPDDRRRLLYNAITRAKQSCLIVVQAQKMLAEAPFS
jgi:hypothetical protein